MHKKLQELKFCLQNVKSCVIVTFKAFTVQNNRCKTPINLMLIKNIFSYVQYGGKEKMAKVGKKSTYVFYTKKNMSPDFYTLKKNYMI